MQNQYKVIIIAVLMFSLLLSGCGSGQLFGPTITPSPTNTDTPTVTPSPTATLIPTLTITPTPTATPIYPPLEVFVGTWKNVDHWTRGWTTIKIAASESGKTVIADVWGACYPSDCHLGKATPTYMGNPIELDFKKTSSGYIFILELDGDTLHVTSYTYFLNEKDEKIKQPGTTYKDDFRR